MGKPKARLLVTRFAPHAARLADLLNAQGIFAVAQPLLQVQKSAQFANPALLFSSDYDYIIAVTGNAVDYTEQALTGQRWPVATYLAVGQGTREKLLSATGQDVVIPEGRYDSEGLLALTCLTQVQDKRVLILRGMGGRELLAEQLIARGAIVEYYQPYQRTAINLDGQSLLSQWQQQNINGVIISSLELLQRLVEIVPTQELSWLKKVTVYAPSKRITEQASLAGWSNVKILPGMLDKQIVDYFK